MSSASIKSRAARIAASFSSSASCAPEKPPVVAATVSRSTSGAGGFEPLCTPRIRRRLEANRLELIRAQWALAGALMERYCEREAA
jgi:hypothetical protein